VKQIKYTKKNDWIVYSKHFKDFNMKIVRQSFNITYVLFIENQI